MNIQHILKYSPEQYNRLIIETYIAYCGIRGSNDKDCQKIMANSAYFNWWLQEYRILEKEFIQDVQPYLPNLDISTIRNFYDEKTTKIANIYSKSLLRKARKTAILNTLKLN